MNSEIFARISLSRIALKCISNALANATLHVIHLRQCVLRYTVAHSNALEMQRDVLLDNVNNLQQYRHNKVHFHCLLRENVNCALEWG